jgi:hypothetical protein
MVGNARHLASHIGADGKGLRREGIRDFEDMVAGRFALACEHARCIFGQWRNHRLVAKGHKAFEEMMNEPKLCRGQRWQHIR